MLLVAVYFDWKGTNEELKEYEEKIEKACSETEDIEYKGLYAPIRGSIPGSGTSR
jgi:hypothetical protein